MGEKRVIEQIASDEIYNDDWFLKDSVLHDTTKVQPSVIKEYMNQGMATSQDLADEVTARQNMDSQLASGISKQMSNLADFYDTTKSYVVGDVVMQQSGDLLRCIAPTSGAFDITKWESVTVDELFDDLNFSAEAISYDNTSSGLEAENVQDAIDEVLETAGKVDDIISNGQSLVENKIADLSSLTAVGSASGDIATFTDSSNLSMPKLEVSIEPVQDLHGYDSPWVGGAGKNKFDSDTVLSALTKNNNKYVGKPSYVADNYVISGGFKTNTRYTLSYKAYNNTSTSSNFRFIFSYTDETEEIIGGFVDTTTEKVIVGTSAENKTISKIKRNYGNGVELTLYDIQLEEGSTATTFAPYSNICPITGWDEANVVRTGKNLFDVSKATANSAINASGQVISGSYYVSDFISVKPNTSVYLLNIEALAHTRSLVFYGINKELISIENVSGSNVANSFVKEIPNNVYYIRIGINPDYINNSGANYPSTDTSYHAYNGHAYTVDLDGTRYGGKVDLVSGVMTVDRIYYQFNNSKTYTITGSARLTDRWITSITNITNVSGEIKNRSGVISSISPRDAEYTTITVSGFCKNLSSPYPIINLNDSDSGLSTSSSATDIANAINTFLHQHTPQIVYELATPLTIQLTPTVVKSLRGQNNVFADTGAILDAEYIRDLTTIIDYILEQLGN